ncbi:aroma-sacti cluster domain-containing protein [Nonomuraea sp. NPDC050643]|uniref:aroma-sacti cluster domain-containing protein n=1 Tax=Nonomuraea sp. NPDC050643 TaxID=3155660 RepID=UPI0033E7F77B
MSNDPLAQLRAAGLDRLPEAQRVVFEDLSPEELRVVGVIQERLNAAAPEVEGQQNKNNTLC